MSLEVIIYSLVIEASLRKSEAYIRRAIFETSGIGERTVSSVYCRFAVHVGLQDVDKAKCV
jgi:hypothetical protein